MSYFDATKRLARTFFEFSKFKKMHIALAVLAYIALAPFTAVFVILIGLLFFNSIIFAFIEAPMKQLHELVTNEGEKVKHATQFIIYFVSWPFIFLLYSLYYFFSLLIIVDYFFVQAIGYIASLGGYKFHVSILEEDIASEDEVGINFVRALVFDIVAVTSLVLFVLFLVLSLVSSDLADLGPIAYAFFAIYVLYCSIYVPVAFHARKACEIKEKDDGVPPMEEEPVQMEEEQPAPVEEPAVMEEPAPVEEPVKNEEPTPVVQEIKKEKPSNDDFEPLEELKSF